MIFTIIIISIPLCTNAFIMPFISNSQMISIRPTLYNKNYHNYRPFLYNDNNDNNNDNNIDPVTKVELNQSNKKYNSKWNSKWNSFLTLIRYQNILPTSFLCFTSGWIINPSLKNVLSIQFDASIVITLIIMSSSMIINDLFDINIDKINNSLRPLVTGAITIPEAIVSTIVLLSVAEHINIQYIPSNLQIITHLSILHIIAYTPIFKKMCIIKNISCAGLITFGFLFAGLSCYNNKIFALNQHFNLFSLALSFIFIGSVYNELLLDIADYEGDKKNNIITIPVLFDLPISWKLANCILYFNYVSNSLGLYYLYNNVFVSLFLFIFSLLPIAKELFTIKKNNYSSEIIGNSNLFKYGLFISLSYFCALSYFL